jgi:hypothetical protein
MWLWGLSGALESNPRQSSVLIPGALQKFVGDIMCNDCCTTSKLEIPSTKQLGEYLDASLRNMPFHGADWAMQCLANFMRLHLKGDRNSRYRTIEPDGHAPGYVYHLWLLDYCPCERCTEARHGQPPRKQVLDLTPYLVST